MYNPSNPTYDIDTYLYFIIKTDVVTTGAQKKEQISSVCEVLGFFYVSVFPFVPFMVRTYLIINQFGLSWFFEQTRWQLPSLGRIFEAVTVVLVGDTV